MSTRRRHKTNAEENTFGVAEPDRETEKLKPVTQEMLKKVQEVQEHAEGQTKAMTKIERSVVMPGEQTW